MGAPLLGKHFAELSSASTPTVVVAAAGSVFGQLAAVIHAAPLWLFVVAALAPWIPILVLELVWTYRHYQWLALFCLMLVTQAAYVVEHVTRAIQTHLLGQSGSGVFGAAVDQHVLHLAWSASSALGLLVLVTRFPRNGFLWAAAAVALGDAVTSSVAPVDAQLAASVLGIVTLNLAFALQLGRTYDAWLARAFPHLPEKVLIEATSHLEEIRLRAGDRIEPHPERLYIVTSGTGALVRPGPGEHEILLRVLAPGQVVRDPGTLTADTALELLALPSSAL